MVAGSRRDLAKWEHWRCLFDEWEKSGLSGADYCRRHNIVYSQFKDWQKKMRRANGGATANRAKRVSAPSGASNDTSRDAPELLTRKQAAEYLGVAEQTLAIWKSSGRYALPVVKVGSLSKYRRSDLDAFLQNNTSKPDRAETRQKALTQRAIAIARDAEVQQRQESIEFAEVKVKNREDEARPTLSDGHIEVVLRSGITLRLTAGSPVELLSSVISLLEDR